MDPGVGWVIPLREAAECEERAIGGKAAKLARLAQTGFRVPGGFLITTKAYEYFLEDQDLARLIRMELGRKTFALMRWEEIWDVALRIRSVFLATPIPQALAQAIVDAVCVVWASLWSDAALLYRQELALDPVLSRMAVVVQEVIDEDRSGVAFGRDPREASRNQSIVEAVPGPCGDLVDGLVDPDRWTLDRSTGSVIEWRAGEREDETKGKPILETSDLSNLHQMLLQVESLFQWPPDTEWTGRGEGFTLLQARPITTAAPEAGDQRGWYLSLRPSMRRLSTLAKRVAEELIPELEELGDRFALEAIKGHGDQQLANAIEERHTAVERWRQIYLEDFIPFAHGVRQLGIYYNDAVQPEDPYEFVGLLRGQQMVASRRNQALQALAEQVRANQALREGLSRAADQRWQDVLPGVQAIPGGEFFIQAFENTQSEFMDIAYGGERLSDRPELLLQTILEMAKPPQPAEPRVEKAAAATSTVQALEERFLESVGPERHEEAMEVLSIGRLIEKPL